uniref:Glycerol-3-phosphate dehydrogenase n=1 Tax=Candidatus Kentrum sp. DK TaxID=2126562 RepID=A0A450S6B6_9GAMM|nr:MAG: Glycerol-3-phosphate dehydrogenase [Candidatus Kentron sp. DK]
MREVPLDAVILGGGIAGLWTLNRAVDAGYNAILLEQDRLGGIQTIRSQGIIHGGIKYALHGALTTTASAIAHMPARWRACLAGTGEIDLRPTRILSDAHYLWSKDSLGARMTAFFASRALQGRISPASPEERPALFRNDRFRGSVYRLNELVLDVESLIRTLAGPMAHRIFRAGPDDYRLEVSTGADSAGEITALTLPAHNLSLEPKQIILCCGQGYEQLASRLSLSTPRMQRRPLHMVMARFPRGAEASPSTDAPSPLLPPSPLYAHHLSGAPRPRITITSHYARDGALVWYLGGEIAESGVERDRKAQIEQTKNTLRELLPWVSLHGARWATLRVDRAEPRQSTLTLPDSAFVQPHKNLIIAWPTKLALAPDLAERVLAACLPPAGRENSAALPAELEVLPRPAIAEPVWERAFDSD